jgi:zinc/manganese transport system substrate-binding protein
VNTTKLMATGVVALSIVGVLAGCSTTTAAGSGSGTAAGGKIVAVGAENEYASVISQIGGSYVSVSSIMSNPNTDPHTFEASASVAKEIGAAKLIVQNGVGYDDFMTKIESSSSAPADDVIVAQKVLGLPDDTPNPHLWYKPSTMPAVAKAIAARLEKLDPSHASTFEKNLATFQASLTPWTNELSTFKATYPDVPVAVTEPVADYALEAAGADIKTPFSLQASIMNDTDPSPQDSATQDALFTGGKVKAFLYNQQVTDAVTSKYLTLAKQNHIPVVGVYETMPTDGYTYQTWMLAEIKALEKALATGTSTEKL